MAADEYALSAIARPGRVRGRPLPRRAMRTCSSSGMNCGQLPCWPGVKIRVTGRHRRSAARWILVLSPPRDRPSAFRPGHGGGLLSFGAAPGDPLGGQRMPGPGGVLVRSDHGGIRAQGPVLPLGLIAPGPQPVQDLLPGPVQRPAAVPVNVSSPKPGSFGVYSKDIENRAGDNGGICSSPGMATGNTRSYCICGDNRDDARAGTPDS